MVDSICIMSSSFVASVSNLVPIWRMFSVEVSRKFVMSLVSIYSLEK